METKRLTDLEAVLEWLTSDDARRAAVAHVRRYRLRLDADDLISETVIAMQQRMSRRTMPLVEQGVGSAAVKFAARAMSNVAKDHARRTARDARHEIELARAFPVRSGAEEQVTSAIFVEQLISSVNDLVRNSPACPGCHKEVVFAAATEVLQLVLIEGASGDDAPRDNAWFDDAIEAVIDRTSPHASQLPSARRKRRSRCTRCVIDLLGGALRKIGYRRG